jgi:hypothetical protein
MVEIPLELKEILKTFIPLVTFIAGLLIGTIGKLIEQRRQRRLIKSIIVQELNRNAWLLNGFVKWDVTETMKTNSENKAEESLEKSAWTNEQATNAIKIARSIARITSSFSFNIYNSYLSKLADLKHKDAEAVFAAYLSLQDLKRISDEYTDLQKQPSDTARRSEGMAARAVGILTISEHCRNSCIKALYYLPGGTKHARELIDKAGKFIPQVLTGPGWEKIGHE